MLTQEGKTDLRIQKTEQALIEAMTRLIKTKTLDRITVSDLCSEANIRRATFYTHFKDKHDFIDFCVQKKQAQLGSGCFCANGSDTLDGCMDMIRGILRYLQDNRTLFEHMARHNEKGNLIEAFTRQLAAAIETEAEHLAQEGYALIAPPQLIAMYFTSALLGMTRWWFMEKTDMTEEELIHHMHTLVSACMPAMCAPEKGGNP